MPKRIEGGSGMRIAITTLIAGFVVCCLARNAGAQATAQISGTVRDMSGAVLPGVQVTATQAETGFSRTVVTTETGFYALPSLPLGPYKVEASLVGFRTFAQSGVLLQVGSSPVIDVKLE